MDDVMMLTGSNITTFLLVLVALLGLFVLAVRAVESVRSLRKPQDQKESSLASHQTECERRFARDYKMLAEHDESIVGLKETNRVLCAGMHALLEHALHNGNSGEMQKASQDLFEHLNKR